MSKWERGSEDLEVHDLAVSKLVAGREKDIAFISALFRHRLAEPETVRERLASTEVASLEVRAAVVARLSRLSAV